ncbi:MAG: prolyl oligopeptidase family serine peptidase [Sciscionella sp.]
MTNEPSFPRLQARTQRFTLGTPRTFRVAPDGSRVVFLRSSSGVDARHNLYRLDPADGGETCVIDAAAVSGGVAEEVLPPEEKARRERSRTQAGGVTGYACDARVRVATVALSGKLYVADLGGGGVREIAVPAPVIDPRPDPTGSRVAYVHGSGVRVHELDSGADRELVGRAENEGEDIRWGLAEFIAAEEMGRARGYWWSPEGDRLLVTRTDATSVPRWHIADPANPQRPPNTVAYPAAGTANVDVTLALVALDGARVDVTWDNTAFPYLSSVHWSAAGAPLLAVQSRDQRTMRVLAVDTVTGATSVLAEDTDPHWVDIVDGVPAWTPDGRLLRVIASGGGYRLLVGEQDISGDGLQVRAVLDVGEHDVLFTASADDPCQMHVYAGGEGGVRRLSQGDGVHSAARGGDVTVLTHWGLSHDGAKVRVLRAELDVVEVTSRAVASPLLPRPVLLTVGERRLRCALLLPSGHREGDRLPVLLDPYGGPHAQRVMHTRGAYLGPQWLADQGFAVLIADGRGTPGRGPEWDRAVHHKLAAVTLADQVDALREVAARYPDLDTSRVAIRGWSYGGYLAALAVLRRPDVFHAAVAGAPVIDWRLYDTHYTERYLGHPDDHPEVYQGNSLLADAQQLRRPLLLIHGLADDNVFAAHSLRLSQALLAAGKAHDVLPLSGVTHMSPTDEAAAEHFLRFQVDWIKRALP